MIRFIDINTGNVYNGDRPYIHWFDGKQSVGINYDKQFIVLSDKEDIEIRCDSEVFFIVDNHKIGYETDDQGNPVEKTFYDKKYLDLDVIKTNYLYHVKDGCEAVAEGYNIYTFNIIACGKYVGEVTDSFFIDGVEYTIGADFVDENEALGINLKNLGTELSNEVQRAIYDKTINEQKIDWVLINRKFKELLNEYIDVIANKGSYKSLVNSLNWFEYGDLVKIYEYWRRQEPTREMLANKDLTEFITQETENLLYTMQKTTYIGISAALEKLLKENGVIQYEDKYPLPRTVLGTVDSGTASNGMTSGVFGRVDYLLNEPNPKLQEVSMLWSKEEMSLKMTLLGNFFATYFMPIHLDLIHSTIENIIYTNTIKSVNFSKIGRTDILDEINDFRCKIDKVYHLNNIEAYVTPDTVFQYVPKSLEAIDNEIHDVNDRRREEVRLVGVDTIWPKNIPVSEAYDYITTYNMQHIKGIGVIIPFNCTLYNFRNTAVITYGRIKVYKNGVSLPCLEAETYDPKFTKEDDHVKIDFNLVIQNIGKYKVQVEFRRSDGISYIKTFDFVVDSEINQTLEMYKLVPRYRENEMKIQSDGGRMDKWFQEDDDENILTLESVADYVMNPVQFERERGLLTRPDISYMQFIAATTKNIYDKVHTNQVVIIRFKNPEPGNPYILPQVQFRQGSKGPKIPFLGMNHFIWLKFDKYGHFIKNTNPDKIISEWGPENEETCEYYVGINTVFNRDGVLKWEFAKNNDPRAAKVWMRDMFIPYFYKLEKVGDLTDFDRLTKNLSDEDKFRIRNAQDTYMIDNDDVVCFLPSIKCIRRPKDFMWKYTCKTTNEEITPITFRDAHKITEKYAGDQYNSVVKIEPNDNVMKELEKPFPAILQPLFGRYDFRILPTPGYYDVTLNYKMDDNDEENRTKTISSQFIVRK